VVKGLDLVRGKISKSELLTRLALDYLININRFADRPELTNLHNSEQSILDDAVSYLEERDDK